MSESPRPERILLVRLSALGDIVACLEALDALRAARPDAELGWTVERRHATLLEGHPQIDRLFVWERRPGGSAFGNARALLALRRELRAWRPDAAVDLQGNLKAAVIGWLSGASRRVGLPRGEAREGAHLFVTETVPPAHAPEHRAERALRLVARVGSAARGAPRLPPIPAADRARIEERLAALALERGEYALLLPGTSDFGAFKRWPAASFAGLAGRLRKERGLASVVGWGPGQKHLAEAVVSAAGGAARLAPSTSDLREFRALASGAALVVGADSGPVSIGTVEGTPTVALFGPKDPAVYAPRGPRTAVVWKAVYCSPCTLRTCDDPICMTTMTVDEVWAAVARVLGEPR